MTLAILLFSAVFFAFAYRWFGGFLMRRCGIDDSRPTPAHTDRDGVDFVPTRASVLFGHHFSSIAGAGPIVGPVLACLYFGWGPTWLWILLGAAFIGGLHDFGSGLISIRRRGQTVAEAMRGLIGRRTGVLFALFVLMALIYVVIVFLDLTASTFQSTPEVATASGWFILVAVVFGQLLARMPAGAFKWLVLALVPLTYAGLAVGHFFPAPALGKEAWLTIIIVYCFVAAVLPVNVLLQPRDFLSATFLYAILAAGVLGVVFSGQPFVQDFFTGWNHEQAGTLVPVLFITVACGACSGFHSMVASGTTSKQLQRESDLLRVNYGAMLVEGILAVFAMSCIAILSREEIAAAGQPVAIFASGAARFMSAIGLPAELGREFTLLAVSTFLLTTLDTCTRLSRFILEELFARRSAFTRYMGTAAVCAVALALCLQPINGQPVWQAIWPLFGATNQLMAAIALVAVMLFLRRSGIAHTFVYPAVAIMIVMPTASLALMVSSKGVDSLLGAAALVQLILALVLVVMASMAMRKRVDAADAISDTHA